jgi:preprotein translocase subunit SecA
LEKFVMLGSIDRLWMDHLDAIDDLRQGIGLRGYAQKDPLVEYKNEAFKMFEQLVFAIDDEIVNRIYKVQVQMPPVMQRQDINSQQENGRQSERNASVAHADTPTTATGLGRPAKPGRNDPCWCGSGKKYKRCHYPN